jgi:DMSO reductase family type II enzyme chaperone
MTIAEITLAGQSNETFSGARSAAYGLLSEAFSYPTVGVATGEWARRFRALTEHLPFELAASLNPPPAVPQDVLQQAYISTFEVGVGRPYCPLYEGSHRGGRMKLMEELVRFYEHFGLKIQPGDQPDHLCAELEFMHYLSFKETAALAHGDAVTDLRRAQRDFLDRHLCRWLPRLRSRIDSAESLPDFYRRASDNAVEFCRRDFVWLKGG